MNLRIPSTYWRYRRRLGNELRNLRETSGYSGNRFAKEIGWSQSKVSRIETGAQIPTETDLSVWCDTLKVSKEERGEVFSLLYRAGSEYQNWRDNYDLSGGASGKQQEILQLESAVSSVCEFHPNLVPGLLQTKSYAEELLKLPFGPRAFGVSDAEIDEMVNKRIERQRIVYDRSKSVRIILLQTALTTRVCSGETLYEQLLRLRDVFEIRPHEFGIIPSDVILPVVPMGCYVIYDDHTVVLETLAGEQQLGSVDDVNYYTSCFNASDQVSVHGHKACSLITRLAGTIKP